MQFQENDNSLNDTNTVGYLHGFSTFAKLYTLTILDDCFSSIDIHVVLHEFLQGVLNFVSFDQFQIEIFNLLVLFETLLLALLIYIWAKYNSDIYERFLLSDTIVDELKEDVSQLKLPKSYTPRI